MKPSGPGPSDVGSFFITVSVSATVACLLWLTCFRALRKNWFHRWHVLRVLNCVFFCHEQPHCSWWGAPWESHSFRHLAGGHRHPWPSWRGPLALGSNLRGPWSRALCLSGGVSRGCFEGIGPLSWWVFDVFVRRLVISLSYSSAIFFCSSM